MHDDQHSRYMVLIVDDEEEILEIYAHRLTSKGIADVMCCQDSREVLGLVEENDVGLLLLDLTMPFLSGDELLAIIRKDYPHLPVIVVTGVNDVSIAVDCMRQGACDYLVKPVADARLVSSVSRALEMGRLGEESKVLRQRFLASEIRHPEAFSEIITNNDRMRSLFVYVEAISDTAQPVLISGETGVGKELIADAIHTLSGRKGEYVRVNVSGLDDTMFADTLFGHHKGSYTGAIKSRGGLVAKAANGTLFLDEIGDMPAASQIKLLRLLESREYYPLGSDMVEKSEARIVAATNRSISELVATGQFRNDLYYRLATHEVEILPLRERKDDLPQLIDSFLEEAAREMRKGKLVVCKELYDFLAAYDFPGNIRELKSMIFDAVSREKNGVLVPKSSEAVAAQHGLSLPAVSGKPLVSFAARIPTLREVTELTIQEALARAPNQAAAARLLGLSPAALSKRLKAARAQDTRPTDN